MPQLNLIRPTDDLMGCRITWDYPDHDDSRPVVSTVELRRRNGGWYTLISQQWEGLETDFLTTFVTDVFVAWSFASPKAVLTAAVSTHRAARAHARSFRHD